MKMELTKQEFNKFYCKDGSKTDYSKLVHFFGEMDLNLSLSFDEVFKMARHVSECCGYLTTFNKQKLSKYIALYGNSGGELILLQYDKKGVLQNIIDKTNGNIHYYGCPDGDLSGLPVSEHSGYKAYLR